LIQYFLTQRKAEKGREKQRISFTKSKRDKEEKRDYTRSDAIVHEYPFYPHANPEMPNIIPS